MIVHDMDIFIGIETKNRIPIQSVVRDDEHLRNM